MRRPAVRVAYCGLDAPALKVTLSQDGKAPTWFELGKKDGALYARRDGDDAILKLDDKKATELIEAFKKL